MVWFIIEAGVALALALGLVAWTLRSRRKPPRDDARDGER